MRKTPFVFVLGLALGLAALSGIAQDRRLPGQRSASEAPIRAIVAEQAVAWNAGDGPAYARHVTPEVSFTNLFGMVMYGAPAFTKRHTEILATFYKGTTKHHAIRRIRFVTPDVAIVDIDNEVRGVKAMPPGIAVPADGIIKTQLMEVFVRRNGQWSIEAYHNVDTKPSPPRPSERDSAMQITLEYGTSGLPVTIPAENVTVLAPRFVPGLPDEQAAFVAAARAPRESVPLRACGRDASSRRDRHSRHHPAAAERSPAAMGARRTVARARRPHHDRHRHRFAPGDDRDGDPIAGRANRSRRRMRS